jgi:hypothetical protein
MKNIAVLRATQSPMNGKRWHCELECGHFKWVTRTKRPEQLECHEVHQLHVHEMLVMKGESSKT